MVSFQWYDLYLWMTLVKILILLLVVQSHWIPNRGSIPSDCVAVKFLRQQVWYIHSAVCNNAANLSLPFVRHHGEIAVFYLEQGFPCLRPFWGPIYTILTRKRLFYSSSGRQNRVLIFTRCVLWRPKRLNKKLSLCWQTCATRLEVSQRHQI